MPIAITNAADPNKGSIVSFGTGALGAGSGTTTLAGATTYNYTDYTVGNGNTLTLGHKAVIKCTGTFTLAAGGSISIADFTGPYAVGAANGYYGSSTNGIAGGGGCGSTITGTPYSIGGSFTPSLYVLQPVDYMTYSAASPVSVLADPTDNMAGGGGGYCGGSPNTNGKGAIKIMAQNIIILGSINGVGTSGVMYANSIGSGGGGGAGVWLVGNFVTGGGTINCGGGYGAGGGGGGGGRVRIDYALGTAPTFTNVAGGASTSATITTYNSMMLLGGGAMSF